MAPRVSSFDLDVNIRMLAGADRPPSPGLSHDDRFGARCPVSPASPGRPRAVPYAGHTGQRWPSMSTVFDCDVDVNTGPTGQVGRRDRARRSPGASPSRAQPGHRVVLDIGCRRRAAHPGLRGLRSARPPAHPDLPLLPQPLRQTDRGLGPGHRDRVHGQRAPLAARLRPALRGGQRRPGRGPERASDHQHRGLRADRGAHRPGGGGAFRAARGRLAATLRAHRRGRPGRAGAGPRAAHAAPARQLGAFRAQGGAERSRPLQAGPAPHGRSPLLGGRRLPRGGGRAGLTLEDIDGLSTYPGGTPAGA